MSAGSIVIDLLMRTGSFETDTKRAQARLKELEREAERVGAAIGTAFVAAAAATAYFVKSSIDAADASIKTAQAVGLTVEAYSSLAFAADLSGVSQEELGTALTKLSRQAADAAGGSATAGAAFKALGISVTEVGGAVKDSDKLLAEIADKFRGYADGAEKTALAVEIFGRAGAKLIPLLNAGAGGIEDLRREAAALGVVLDTQTAKAAEQFNDDLSRLGATLRGFGNAIAADALPALNEFNALLLDLARNQEIMQAVTGAANFVLKGLLVTFQALVVLGSDVAFVLMGVGRELGAIAAQAAALARLDLNGFRAISNAVKEDGERARATLDAFQARVMALGQQGRGGMAAPAGMAAALGIGSPMLAAPRAPTLPSGGGAGAARKAESEASRRLADQFKAEAEQERQWREEQAKAARQRAQEAEALQRELAQIFDATRTPLERLNIELSRLAELRLVAGANLDALARAEFDAWERYEQQIRKTGEEMDQFAKTMAENVQGFLGSAFADAIEGNFKSIGQAFTQMVNRMVAEALAAELTRKLFGGSGGGSGEGWIGAAVSALGSFFGGAKAGGGDVMPGRSYWVGERGPERFVPRTMGTVMPASAAAGGGAAVRQISMSINVQAVRDMSRQTALQQGEYIGRGIQRSLARNG